MDFNFMDEYRKRQEKKYQEFKNKEKRKNDINILKELNFSDDNCELIIDNQLIEKIQAFFRKYRFSDKICLNFHNIIDYKDSDVIKFREGNDIFGYHYMHLLSYLERNGNMNPYTQNILNNSILNRIQKLISNKNKYIFTEHSEYFSFNSISFNQGDCWNPAEIYGLFESRGISSVDVPENVFNEMIDLPPSLYALEIISENNINRAYAAFGDFPSSESVQLPLSVYCQLKILPKDVSELEMRIIEPPKGTKIKLRCMITKDKLLEDIKGKLTSEINKHRIISLNQVIVVESDINFGMIPFRIEYLEPSNVVSIADVEIEVDFLDSLPYEDPMESLLIELNR